MPEIPLVLIVGAARSGTTLLRFLLDAHREIGCPAETGLPVMVQQAARVWWTVLDGPAELGDDWLTALPEQACGAIRAAIQAPMAAYCTEYGKRIYCDKSLDSVDYLAAIHRVLPGTRYIMLVRHVMDTVASGLEASPWGFHNYGYLPYVKQSPENLVAALASHWHAHISKALAWQAAHPSLCHLVRYEDLVREPERALRNIWAFLNVDDDFSTLSGAFVKAKLSKGPGDHKVTYTDSVHAHSIGRGRRVPINLLPPPVLTEMNTNLGALGYEALDSGWNAKPAPESASGAQTQWGERLRDRIQAVDFGDRDETQDELGPFALIAHDDVDLRWVIDPAERTVSPGDGSVEAVITGTTEDLVLMIDRKENLASLMRSGRIRHITDRNGVSAFEVHRAMGAILGVLSQPSAPSLRRP